MNIFELPDFINLCGKITIIVCFILGVIGWGGHWLLTVRWAFGKDNRAAFLRLFVPMFFCSILIPALVAYLLVEHYLPVSDALSQYNSARLMPELPPELDIAGKFLFLIYDISGNETTIGKILLGSVSAVIGMASYLLFNTLHGLCGYAYHALRGGH